MASAFLSGQPGTTASRWRWRLLRDVSVIGLMAARPDTLYAAKGSPEGSLDFAVDYDGSRSRTSAYHTGIDLEWGTATSWIGLSLDAYSDPGSSWSLNQDAYASLVIGASLWTDKTTGLELEATLELDAHSFLSDKGAGISPEATLTQKLSPDWEIGLSVGATFATSPEAGNRAGYASVDLWLTWHSALLPDESDYLTLRTWAATNEEPGAGKALFIDLEYEFDLPCELEGSVGLGTDPYSSWEHLGVYLTVGLGWRY